MVSALHKKPGEIGDLWSIITQLRPGKSEKQPALKWSKSAAVSLKSDGESAKFYKIQKHSQQNFLSCSQGFSWKFSDIFKR